MNRSDIYKFIGPDWDRMKDLMREALHSDIGILLSTNNSVLDNSGKLLRPLLTFLIARACGSESETTIYYAAGVECLHNATLIHDDVADDSMERRGSPTLFSVLGPTAAVLIGDFWLAKAVELVMQPGQHKRVVSYFIRTLSNLSEGEMLQLEKASSADTQEEDYYRIIYCKTASLFEAAAVAAADSVDAPDNLFEAARDYGRYMGLAFQIKDDILDYAGTSALGKPIGNDLKEQKITLPLLGALKDSPQAEQIRSMIRSIHSHPEYCGQIKDFVLQNGGIEYASAKLDEYVDKAVACLEVFSDSPAKEYLIQIARYNKFRRV